MSVEPAPQMLDRATRLKQFIVDLGRLRPLRDPIASLAPDLTPPQIHTVMWLGTDGPLPLSVIAQRVGCASPTVTGIVDRLEKVGLVERERDAADRRVVHVRLTDFGREAYLAFDRAFTGQLALLLDHLSQKDCDQFLRLMGTLVERVRAKQQASTPSTPPEES